MTAISSGKVKVIDNHLISNVLASLNTMNFNGYICRFGNIRRQKNLCAFLRIPTVINIFTLRDIPVNRQSVLGTQWE